MNEVLTTYLPTALLIIISYSTTFFSEGYFEANLSVNLSVMFVMTTLFVSVMEKLPQTSYIRMVDVWLIFGQLFPFLEVVLVTYIEHFRLPSAKENQQKQLEVKDIAELNQSPGSTGLSWFSSQSKTVQPSGKVLSSQIPISMSKAEMFIYVSRHQNCF